MLKKYGIIGMMKNIKKEVKSALKRVKKREMMKRVGVDIVALRWNMRSFYKIRSKDSRK
jgi:hypothetical protein